MSRKNFFNFSSVSSRYGCFSSNVFRLSSNLCQGIEFHPVKPVFCERVWQHKSYGMLSMASMVSTVRSVMLVETSVNKKTFRKRWFQMKRDSKKAHRGKDNLTLNLSDVSCISLDARFLSDPATLQPLQGYMNIKCCHRVNS